MLRLAAGHEARHAADTAEGRSPRRRPIGTGSELSGSGAASSSIERQAAAGGCVTAWSASLRDDGGEPTRTAAARTSIGVTIAAEPRGGVEVERVPRRAGAVRSDGRERRTCRRRRCRAPARRSRSPAHSIRLARALVDDTQACANAHLFATVFIPRDVTGRALLRLGVRDRPGSRPAHGRAASSCAGEADQRRFAGGRPDQLDADREPVDDVERHRDRGLAGDVDERRERRELAAARELLPRIVRLEDPADRDRQHRESGRQDDVDVVPERDDLARERAAGAATAGAYSTLGVTARALGQRAVERHEQRQRRRTG